MDKKLEHIINQLLNENSTLKVQVLSLEYENKELQHKLMERKEKE